MINQVEFEGYLTRAWEYREQKYMRLANHRLGENGRTQTDYVTVQIDSSLDFDPCRIKVGRLLRVAGRIVGRDIVEPLKLVVSKSHEGIQLPDEVSTLVIRRPTVQILATRVKTLVGSKPPRKKTGTIKDSKPSEITPIPVVSVEPGQDLAELVPAQ